VPPRTGGRARRRSGAALAGEAGIYDGHRQRILDWELTALQARYRPREEDKLKAAITRNLFEIPFAANRAPMIFVGNQGGRATTPHRSPS
jgi:hypothetical protein